MSRGPYDTPDNSMSDASWEAHEYMHSHRMGTIKNWDWSENKSPTEENIAGYYRTIPPQTAPDA